MLLPQEHTVMVRQTNRWGQIILLSLVGLGATAFATAWFYRLDEVITVQGRLVPRQGDDLPRANAGKGLSSTVDPILRSSLRESLRSTAEGIRQRYGFGWDWA